LVIPRGLLEALLASAEPTTATGFAEDPTTRAETERLAMEAVRVYERALGNVPRDVSAEKKGWDIESRASLTGYLRFIEVKGRQADARDVIVTKNEILASLNAPDAFHLALVKVENGFAHQPVYVKRFFRREPGFGETAIVFDLTQLLSLTEPA
jgi:predicted nucleic acid-binding protein